jgi:hypothetical protein
MALPGAFVFRKAFIWGLPLDRNVPFNTTNLDKRDALYAKVLVVKIPIHG